MTQGEINGMAVKLASEPEKLKQFMADKSEKEKEQARSHLRTVKALRGRK